MIFRVGAERSSRRSVHKVSVQDKTFNSLKNQIDHPIFEKNGGYLINKIIN
ncbi:MAG: hypothetical protein U1E78_09455 [Gammaproteobacteria bacterium]